MKIHRKIRDVSRNSYFRLKQFVKYTLKVIYTIILAILTLNIIGTI